MKPGVYQAHISDVLWDGLRDEIEVVFSTAHGQVSRWFQANSKDLIETIAVLHAGRSMPVNPDTEECLSLLRALKATGLRLLISYPGGDLIHAVPFEWQANAIDISRDRAGRWFYE